MYLLWSRWFVWFVSYQCSKIFPVVYDGEILLRCKLEVTYRKNNHSKSDLVVDVALTSGSKLKNINGCHGNSFHQ